MPNRKRNEFTLQLRRNVWTAHIGDVFYTQCYTGCGRQVTPFTFYCGHVISKADGGQASVTNLRPICGPCLSSIRGRNLYDFSIQNAYRCRILDDYYFGPVVNNSQISSLPLDSSTGLNSQNPGPVPNNDSYYYYPHDRPADKYPDIFSEFRNTFLQGLDNITVALEDLSMNDNLLQIPERPKNPSPVYTCRTFIDIQNKSFQHEDDGSQSPLPPPPSPSFSPSPPPPPPSPEQVKRPGTPFYSDSKIANAWQEWGDSILRTHKDKLNELKNKTAIQKHENSDGSDDKGDIDGDDDDYEKI